MTETDTGYFQVWPDSDRYGNRPYSGVVGLEELCASCGGRGQVMGEYPDGSLAPFRDCRTCDGMGMTLTEEGERLAAFISHRIVREDVRRHDEAAR